MVDIPILTMVYQPTNITRGHHRLSSPGRFSEILGIGWTMTPPGRAADGSPAPLPSLAQAPETPDEIPTPLAYDISYGHVSMYIYIYIYSNNNNNH